MGAFAEQLYKKDRPGINKLSEANDNRQTYYMLAVEVIYAVDKEDKTEIGTRHFNVMVITPSEQFSMAQIAQAHMGAQKSFNEKVTDPTAQIIDLTIMSMMKLGRFTPEEFGVPAKPDA